MDNDDLTTCEGVRNLREGALFYWRPLYEARSEERAFLDGDRYEDNTELYNKDRRRQQFRGQETSNVNRHKAAVATSAPRQIEALPVDQITDPDDAEIAVSLLEWELSVPEKGFPNTIRAVVQDAVDCRAGAAMLEFDPDLGTWGELYTRWKDPNLLMYEPGGWGDNPHHLKCGWFQEVRRMKIPEVQAMGKLKGKAKWKYTQDIYPDGDVRSVLHGATNSDGSPRIDGATSGGDIMGIPGAVIDDKHVWVLFCWYKYDHDSYEKDKAEHEIAPEDRYQACDNPECSYRGINAQESVEVGVIEDLEQLEEFGEPCPMCGAPVSRRDYDAEFAETLSQPKGRKLVIMPLLQRTPDDKPFYEGPWPVPNARSFPLLWITAYPQGGRPMGDSDTTRNWDAQIASDQLMTMAFDRIMRHQVYYGMPDTGMYDYRGQRFEFRDDQFNTIFFDTSDPNVPLPQVQIVQGSALDAAWPNYWQAVQTVLLSHQGITDFGLDQESSKDIPVGTAERIEKVGEIPVADFIRRKNDALGPFYGVYWDHIRYTYPAERLARLQLGGEMIVEALKGDELPNMDFIVSEAPDFSGLDDKRQAAATALIQIASTTPQWLDVYAVVNKFPPSVVRMVKRKMAEMQAAEAEAQMMGAGMEEVPPLEMEEPPPDPMEALMGAQNGAPIAA